MFDKRKFYDDILNIALPITVQCFFQSSVSVIDQIMVGQLGSISIAGAGLGGKFSSLFSVTVSAIATGAGILVAQYYGSKSKKGVNDSFVCNMYFSLIISLFFTLISLFIPMKLMSVYSTDVDTISSSASYLKIVSISFIPMTLTLMISTLLRCIGCAKYPMFPSIIAVLLNTLFNYLLIFGKYIFPQMGLQGAAWATNIARICEFLLIFIFFLGVKKKKELSISLKLKLEHNFIKKVILILYPILICEFLWSLGENGYAMIYGRIGTEACAAMTLTNPIQSLLIGIFSGIAAASGIISGKALGDRKYEDAYAMSKKIFHLGLIGSLIIGIFLALTTSLYVKIFPVDYNIKRQTTYILYAFSLILFAKVSNMILGGGILRSGGNTKVVMFIDIVGTWIIGIPTGFVAAFIFGLPIYEVYFLLSLEELVRLGISLVIFKKRMWVKNIT